MRKAKWLKSLLTATAAVALIGVAPVQASATPVKQPGPAVPVPAGASVTRVAAPDGPAAALDYDYYCFGYRGRFLTDSSVLLVDWQTDGTIDECFGIGTNRRIYHAWPNSGGWKLMPYGFGDDTVVAWTEGSARNVMIWVRHNNTFWCSTYPGTPGTTWSAWYQC